MTEIIRIADATGCTVAQLTGTAIADRVQYAARATNGSAMEKMRQRLLHFIELDAYLDDQAIPVPRRWQVEHDAGTAGQESGNGLPQQAPSRCSAPG